MHHCAPSSTAVFSGPFRGHIIFAVLFAMYNDCIKRIRIYNSINDGFIVCGMEYAAVASDRTDSQRFPLVGFLINFAVFQGVFEKIIEILWRQCDQFRILLFKILFDGMDAARISFIGGLAQLQLFTCQPGYETAGSLQDGRRTFILKRLPERFNTHLTSWAG